MMATKNHKLRKQTFEKQEDDELIATIKGQIDLEDIDYSQWQRTQKLASSNISKPIQGWRFDTTVKARGLTEITVGPRPISTISRPFSTQSDKKHLSEKDQEKIKVLKLKIKARKQTITEYIRRQKKLLDSNLDLKKEIEDVEEHSHSNVKQFLRKYEKFRGGIATLNDKFSKELDAAKAELAASADRVCRHLKKLEKEVNEADKRLKDKQSELRILNNYKDKEYPVKALKIADLKKEIEMLKQSNKEEQDELDHIVETELGKFEKERQQVRKDMIERVTQDAWGMMHPSLKELALQNMVMRKEIEVHGAEIEDLRDQVSEAEMEVNELRCQSVSDARKHAFPELFTSNEKCTPDMDIVLDIPTHDWLPI